MMQEQAAKEYQVLLKSYALLQQQALETINTMLSDHHFLVMPVFSRIKTQASVLEKLQRKAHPGYSLSQMTDILGMRIICYFSDDVDRIGDLIRTLFVIDEENSIDKRKALESNQFGYMSLHYICSLRPGPDVPEMLLPLRFEIQIRTVLQHAWAEISHDLGYKSQFGLPADLQRLLSMMAGLMEFGDKGFLSLRDGSSKYITDVKQRIADDDADTILLNAVSLGEYLQHSQKMLRFYERIQDECGVEIIHADSSSLLNALNWLRITALGELNKVMDRNADAILADLRSDLADLGLDIATDQVVLRTMIEEESLRRGIPKEAILY